MMHTSYLYYNIYCIAFSAFSGPHVGLDSNLKNTLLSTATVTIVYTIYIYNMEDIGVKSLLPDQPFL